MTDHEKQIAIETLMAARDAARVCMRQAWDELDDDAMARHWSAVAGWLAHRAEEVANDGEPLGDAFMVTFGTGMEPTDGPVDHMTPTLRQRFDEFQAVRDRGMAEAQTAAIVPAQTGE